MVFRYLLFSLLAALVSCESTAPTAAQMDELEVKVRAQYREDYAQLDQQRAAGEIINVIDRWHPLNSIIKLRLTDKLFQPENI